MFKPVTIEKKTEKADGTTVTEVVTLETPEAFEAYQAAQNKDVGQAVFAVKVRRVYSIKTQNYHIPDEERATWPAWMRNMVVGVRSNGFSISGSQPELDRFLNEFNAMERKRA